MVTIPVVFHVLYANSTQNISDAQIQSQLDILNADFRRTNSDQDNVWGSVAADTEIEFCLASFDPNGAPTNGILRVPTSVSSFGSNDAMKFSSQGGSDAWPASDYLNYWVCNLSGGLLGYAHPGGPANTTAWCAVTSTLATSARRRRPFNLGRTGTHEVGHWLNLRHIWGDGACGADDFVADTPESDGANYGCALGHVSCNTTDMVQNYMDYSDDGCMNLFTAGQAAGCRPCSLRVVPAPACSTPTDVPHPATWPAAARTTRPATSTPTPSTTMALVISAAMAARCLRLQL